MCCFSGVGGLPDSGDQAVSHINPPANLEITRPNAEEVECCCCTKKMSSGSSEVDVKRTRIPAYDDDNTVLYAYEPHTAYVHNEAVLSDTSYNEEQQKTVQDVLTHCQVIYDAIQNLDKKFDVIDGKVSKIHRLRVKSIWQNRKPFRYAYKNYNYLLSRKIRFQKMRRKETPSLSEPKSYSPTIPVERPNYDFQSSSLETSYHAEPESPERDPESLYQRRESRMSRSPSLLSIFTTQSYRPYFTPDPVQEGSSCIPCYDSPEAHSTTSLFSPLRASTAIPEGSLTQADPSSPENRDMMAFPSSPENESLGHTASSLYIPGNFATGSPVGNNPGVLRDFPADPSTWSVDEVILFLKQADPQTLTPIADLFRQHDIDGKALLLLKSDMMLKYMGLKLGTAVKLCHYIDGLRGEKHIDN
ncbi:sex comb on midleg-like protein 1 isoform X2 [Panthera uncia]|uniref:sex comb on midleg-like protein 1 isoform X2 n=1 Tax=Panthera uncia TaxID=29064 RepID=UPI0020FFE7D5|nr:sex comb on midleg-like protein 1 isoform X2 [Panthera uncia]